MTRWHRTTIAAANPPATEPMPPAAQRQAPHTLPVSAPEPVAEDGRRDPAALPSVRHRRPAGLAKAQCVLRAGEGGFPPERTNGTAVSGGRRGGTATRRRIRRTGLAVRRTAAPRPPATWG